MDMSPHRHVYINYSSALEVMRAQLQMLEKKKKDSQECCGWDTTIH